MDDAGAARRAEVRGKLRKGGRPWKSNRAVPEGKLCRKSDGSGGWEIRWTEWDAAAGRARSRSYSCRTTDYTEALAVFDEWRAAMADAAGARLARSGSVAELLDDYMAARGFEWSAAAGGVGSGSSQSWALWPVKRALGSRKVLELTPEVLVDYKLARLRTVKRDGKKVQGPTVRRELSALGAAVKWGQKAGKVPWDFRFVLDLPPTGAPRTRYLSEAEEEAVWSAAVEVFMDRGKPFSQRRIGLFVCLAMETAARKEAVLGLTWDRVRGGLIDFRDPGKAASNKRRVAVPVSDRLKPVLAQAQLDVMVGIGGGPKWVLGHDGEVKDTFDKFRTRLLESGAVKETFNIHDLRRTWASLRVSWGVPLEQVAAVLGDGLEIVQKHYAHLSPGFLVSAVNMRPPAAGGPQKVVAA